jgi:hypothetical protein
VHPPQLFAADDCNVGIQNYLPGAQIGNATQASGKRQDAARQAKEIARRLKAVWNICPIK